MMQNHRRERLDRAGFTVEQAAQKLGVTSSYLRRILRQGRAPFVFANKLSRLLGCRMETFL